MDNSNKNETIVNMERGIDTDNEEVHINENLDQLEEFFGAMYNANNSKVSQSTWERVEKLKKQFNSIKPTTENKQITKPDTKHRSNLALLADTKQSVRTKLELLKEETDLDLTTDSEESESSSKESDSTDMGSKSTQKSKKLKNRMKTRSSSTRILEKLVDKLDSRPYLELDSFDDKSGETLKEYLKRFENHCKHNTRGDSKLQIKLLEEKLSGQTLKAFKSFRSKSDRFEDSKRKILHSKKFVPKPIPLARKGLRHK